MSSYMVTDSNDSTRQVHDVYMEIEGVYVVFYRRSADNTTTLVAAFCRPAVVLMLKGPDHE